MSTKNTSMDNTPIRTICDMFERKFSFSDVKKIYETNGSDAESTIEALMAVAVEPPTFTT